MEIKANQIKKGSIEEKLKDISKEVRDILMLFVSEGIIDIKKIEFKGDLENNLKQKIEDSIKERYQDLNERFSELRKSGKDLGVLNFKLIMIPLKIKVFLATYNKKDAENIIKRIKDIEQEINQIKI